MAPTRYKGTPGATRSTLQYDPAQKRGVRPARSKITTAGLRALIAAASVAATVGGWSALSISDALAQAQAQAQVAQDVPLQTAALDTQPSSQVITLPDIPAVPTLVPLPAQAGVPAAQPQQEQQSAARATSTPTAQTTLRSVTVPNPSAQRPAPITRSRSSR